MTATLLGIDRRLCIVILIVTFLVFRHLTALSALIVFALLWSGAYWVTRYDPDFIAFLSELVLRVRWAKEIHIVLDGLSAHKTKSVGEFLARHPKVRFHFTQTYSSWLNQVELWFAEIQRDLLARGIFRSVADLSRKIRKYVRAYANVAHR